MRGKAWITAATAAAALACASPAGAAAPSDVGDVARMYGISQSEAADRLEVQHLAGSLEADARRLYPDTFAGLWLDGGGAGGISIAFTRDAGASVARLASEFARPLLLRPVSVRHSQNGLEALQARMIADREAARSGRWSLAGVPGARYNLDIDPRRNAVILRAERPTAATVAAVRARYGDAVLVETGAIGGPAGCSRDDCEYSLRSGLKTETNQTGGWCSTAFTVRNSSGARNILSAAHCGGDNRYHGNEIDDQYGTVLAQQQAYKVDAERHGATRGEFNARGWIFVDTDHKTRPVTGVSTYSGLSVGATICKSGATTGKTCGTLAGKNNSPHWVDFSNSFLRIDSMCTKDGDSGAGAYIDNRAVAIVSGGDDDQICNNGNDETIAGHIEFAANALNATVITSESRPAFNSVSADSSNSWVTTRFEWPVSCSTVQTSDFTVRMNGVPLTVTSEGCAEFASDSDPVIELFLDTPLIAGTTIEVSVVGNMSDPGGNTVPLATRSTVVR